jgi:hypothetical protein
VITDPIERIVADGLDAAGIAYVHEDATTKGLDFRLVASGVFIEVKQYHAARIATQMARDPNVIAIQGRAAAEWFAAMLR